MIAWVGAAWAAGLDDSVVFAFSVGPDLAFTEPHLGDRPGAGNPGPTLGMELGGLIPDDRNRGWRIGGSLVGTFGVPVVANTRGSFHGGGGLSVGRYWGARDGTWDLLQGSLGAGGYTMAQYGAGGLWTRARYTHGWVLSQRAALELGPSLTIQPRLTRRDHSPGYAGGFAGQIGVDLTIVALLPPAPHAPRATPGSGQPARPDPVHGAPRSAPEPEPRKKRKKHGGGFVFPFPDVDPPDPQPRPQPDRPDVRRPKPAPDDGGFVGGPKKKGKKKGGKKKN